MSTPVIGLALSGGGSRAIAFHLGCLRALHDRGILQRVRILSGVSGGSVIAALYAYSAEPFDVFERRIETLLATGMVGGVARQTFFSSQAPLILISALWSGVASILASTLQALAWILGLFKLRVRLFTHLANVILDAAPRFATFTTAFERHLVRRYFGQRRMNEVARPGLDVVLNAAELRTGSAFRYGSLESGCWRFGRLTQTPYVATAVAASAAFPAFLPALDCRLEFTKAGSQTKHRAIITDGGVYDNLGVSCMLPGRSGEFSTNAFSVDYIIACDAGQGIPTGAHRPMFWMSRMLGTILTIHRRTQTLTQTLLHRLQAGGEIRGFVMPYLGQQDAALPVRPPDLVPREDVFEYPTDFNPMTKENIGRLSLRGEQLTRCLLGVYTPTL